MGLSVTVVWCANDNNSNCLLSSKQLLLFAITLLYGHRDPSTTKASNGDGRNRGYLEVRSEHRVFHKTSKLSQDFEESVCFLKSLWRRPLAMVGQ